MNIPFIKPAPRLARSAAPRHVLKSFAGLGGMAVSVLALPVVAQVSHLSPLVELSQPSPVSECLGLTLPGTWEPTDAAEPSIAVNPAQPNNIVASWIFGPGADVVSGVSFDGGRSWQQVPLPLTTCSGGPFDGAADPWLSFGPDGALYAINGMANSLAAIFIGVNKSTDGGLHWSSISLVTPSPGLGARPTIAADASDARFAYALWQGTAKNTGPAMFSRTTNGGQSWEPPYALVQPPTHYSVDYGQFFVLPNGTLVDLFLLFYLGANQSANNISSIAILQSTDHGQSWSTPSTAVQMQPIFQPKSAWSLIVDPETGQLLHDAGDPAFAMNPNNGNLYAVWEDGRFSAGQINEIAFSMSADGGLTWSTPIRVNRTPTNVPLLNRQAFLPSVAVLGDGTIGVSYYDFRFNDPNPGLPTDYWLVQCHPSATVSPTNSANWGNEVRLTDTSFNLESGFLFPNEFFLGDYVNGLAASANGFVAAFTAVDQNNITSIFARRVGP